MQCLEEKYGRWNTANILKIQRDAQDFVILNIFFHDVFTPWFYTQGPIKNDEEWIRTDFRTMCQTVQGIFDHILPMILKTSFNCIILL